MENANVNYRDLPNNISLQKKLIAVSDYLQGFPAFHMRELKQLDVFDGYYIIPIGFLAIEMLRNNIKYTKTIATKDTIESSLKRVNFGVPRKWNTVYKSPFSQKLLSIIDSDRRLILIDGFSRAYHMFEEGLDSIETLAIDISDYEALTARDALFPKKIVRTKLEQKRLLEVARNPVRPSSITNGMDRRFFMTAGKATPLVDHRVAAIGTEKILKALRSLIALELHARAKGTDNKYMKKGDDTKTKDDAQTKKDTEKKKFRRTEEYRRRLTQELDDGLSFETARRQSRNAKSIIENTSHEERFSHVAKILKLIKSQEMKDDDLLGMYRRISAACEFLHSCQKFESHYRSNIFRDKRNAKLTDECCIREKLSQLAPDNLGFLTSISLLARETGIAITNNDENDVSFYYHTEREIVEINAITHRIKSGCDEVVIDPITALNFLSRIGHIIDLLINKCAPFQKVYSETDMQWIVFFNFALNLKWKQNENNKSEIDDRLIIKSFNACIDILEPDICLQRSPKSNDPNIFH